MKILYFPNSFYLNLLQVYLAEPCLHFMLRWNNELFNWLYLERSYFWVLITSHCSIRTQI